MADRKKNLPGAEGLSDPEKDRMLKIHANVFGHNLTALLRAGIELDPEIKTALLNAMGVAPNDAVQTTIDATGGLVEAGTVIERSQAASAEAIDYTKPREEKDILRLLEEKKLACYPQVPDIITFEIILKRDPHTIANPSKAELIQSAQGFIRKADPGKFFITSFQCGPVWVDIENMREIVQHIADRWSSAGREVKEGFLERIQDKSYRDMPVNLVIELKRQIDHDRYPYLPFFDLNELYIGQRVDRKNLSQQEGISSQIETEIIQSDGTFFCGGVYLGKISDSEGLKKQGVVILETISVMGMNNLPITYVLFYRTKRTLVGTRPYVPYIPDLALPEIKTSIRLDETDRMLPRKFVIQLCTEDTLPMPKI